MIQQKLRESNESYPTSAQIMTLIKKYKKIWSKEEKSVLKELSTIMRLQWKEKKVKCYIVGYGRSLNDPLTVSLSNKGVQFVDTLTHELIHQLQTQNYKKMRKWFPYIEKNWGNERKATKTHILLHAVHTLLLKKRYGLARLRKNKGKSVNSPDYKRSWEIVETEGAEFIIKKFRELIK